jgi:tRNA pseudouridine38-40 synthase
LPFAKPTASFTRVFDALRKTYEYRIFREEICPPFERHFVFYHPYPLNEMAMTEVARLFEGEHDFSAFSASDPKDVLGASKVRHILRSTLERTETKLIYRVTGSGFLKHMVRNMVGVLLEIGKGNLTSLDLHARFDPENAIRPGPTAPASGLFLLSVEYDESAFSH